MTILSGTRELNIIYIELNRCAGGGSSTIGYASAQRRYVYDESSETD